jgi:phage tail-like protein
MVMEEIMAQQSQPLSSFSFRVEIDGMTATDFLAVEGVESLTDIIEYRTGNSNGAFAHKLPGIHHTGNVVLRRELSANNELWLWRKTVQDGTRDVRNVAVIVLDNTRQEVARILLHTCWPCRWSLGALDALVSEMALEEVELAVERIAVEKSS